MGLRGNDEPDVFEPHRVGEKMDEGQRQSDGEDERVGGKFSDGRGYCPPNRQDILVHDGIVRLLREKGKRKAHIFVVNKKQRYDRDNTYIFARASIQIGAGDSYLYGCSYRIYGRRPVLRHQESETERRGYYKYGAKEDLRQGKEVFSAIPGNGVHRPDSLYRDAVPGILDDMGRVLRVL